MKVVLFCGGLGTRLREHSDTIPKPLVNVGVRPIVWHLMRYYAHYGHKEFILALGYRGEMVREYFRNYDESLSNDFTWSDSGRTIELHTTDTSDWRITFVDTGLHANIGQRLLRVRDYLRGESVFLANYSDGLADLRLDHMLADFEAKKAVASFAAVRSSQSFHTVVPDADGFVQSMEPMRNDQLLINGGFFILRQNIFDYIRDGDELVDAPFKRLIAEKKLAAWRHLGFWQAMDTFKDKITLDRMEAQGDCPWMVWKPGNGK